MTAVTLQTYDPNTYAADLVGAGQGYEIPHKLAPNARTDVTRIARGLLAIDADVAALFAALVNIYTKTEVDARITAIVGAAPAALDTLVEIGNRIVSGEDAATAMLAQLEASSIVSRLDTHFGDQLWRQTNTGPAGAAGAQGPAGPAGAQGPAGAAGAAGAQGPQGAQGPAGAQGAQGAQGPQGPTGGVATPTSATAVPVGGVLIAVAVGPQPIPMTDVTDMGLINGGGYMRTSQFAAAETSGVAVPGTFRALGSGLFMRVA